MSGQGPLRESDNQQLLARVIGININGKGITISEGGTRNLDDGAPSWAECKFNSLSVYNLIMNRRVACSKYTFKYIPHIIIFNHPLLPRWFSCT